jgi:tetratricopeptide (TPR) repeat protein
VGPNIKRRLTLSPLPELQSREGDHTTNIFISYRREDASAYAGRLCDYLSGIVGAERVFMDVEDIAPGQDFAHTIDGSISSCQTALIVIGPRWTHLMQQRSEKQERDYVLHEVSSALAHKLTIVPVLVGGAKMPKKAQLPPALSALPSHHAAELRDSSFKQDCEYLARNLRLSSSRTLKPRAIVLACAALAALLAVLALWYRPTSQSRRQVDPRLATARTQTELGEYRSAFQTYREILKTAPNDSDVMDLQTAAAMAWLRDFRVTIGEGQKAEDIAGPPLADITSVLEAALGRSGGKGPKAGDILAHLGWAHWLNQHIAQKEFGPAAERALRQALKVDPTNVFAHAMLGNWLLQNHGNTAEALRHFNAAEKTKLQRPLLRQMQLGGMIYHSDPEIPSALMRVVNRMRIAGEPLDARMRSRVLTYFRPGNGEELQKMLTAVPPSDAWATFLWLDEASQKEGRTHGELRRQFIHARTLEIEGKTAEAREILTELDHKMRSNRLAGRLADDVSTALDRLRSPAATALPPVR